MTQSNTTLLCARFEIEKQIRRFLWSKNFTEVRTPLLVKCPGMEPHIRPIEVSNPHSTRKTFLPTSPEFGMKKLIGAGMTNIFQLCPSFRDEPQSVEHHPEFTLLEFYESNTSLEMFQTLVEQLIQHLIRQQTADSSPFHYQGKRIYWQDPWPRFRIPDLFEEHLGIDLREHQDSSTLAHVCKKVGISASAKEPWDDLYFKLWLNCIEPKLSENRFSFVTHYPTRQSSLCNTLQDEKGFTWAKRFELYLGHLELGNAFDELLDPKIQLENFKHDQDVRKAIYGDSYPESPLDDDLLAALPKMPPTCGIAIGVDRLCMILLDLPTIDSVLPLKSYWG